MKNKLYILITCCLSLNLITISAISCTKHPMKINIILKSLSPNIDNLNQIKYGYQFEFQYGFTQNIYAKAISIVYNTGKIGYGGRLGYTFNVFRFSPYAEVGFDSKPIQNQLTTYAAYDVGSYYHINSCVSPFIELDNGDIPKRTTAKFGSVFQMNKSLGIKLDYIQDINNNGNGAEVELSYNF